MTNLTEIREFANEVLRDEHLAEDGWTFTFNGRLRRALGRCCYSDRTIELSRDFAVAHGLDEHVKDTILHEVAHALTPGHGHDKVWKRVARRLGATPRATNKAPLKYSYHRWELRYGDRVVAKYASKPRRDISKLYLKSVGPRSMGELTLHKVA